MPDSRDTGKVADLYRLEGALEILDALREEMAQWLEEAQDAPRAEELANVLGHIEAMEEEYRERLKGRRRPAGVPNSGRD